MELNDEARGAVDRLLETLATDDSIRAVAAFGSAVRGDFDPRRSDVNVMIALSTASLEALTAIAPALRDARRRDRVQPFVVEAKELPRLADVFPIRVLDMKRRHVLLRGDDLLAPIDVERRHLRLRVEQELRNHLLRTRRAVLEADEDAATLMHVSRVAVRRLRLELWALTVLLDDEPAELEPVPVLTHAARLLDVDARSLDALLDAGAEDPPARTRALLDLLARAIRAADELEVA
ncbi:MAG: nucleotidyltransferase domain-containing protein [Sandaracinaceae bacterium]